MGQQATLLDTVKASCRVKSSNFDVELTSHINAAVQDLRLAGVHVPEQYTAAAELTASAAAPLFIEAITLYAKGHFGYLDDTQRYLNLYESRKRTLKLAGGGIHG